MNVNVTRNPSPVRMHEAPGTRPTVKSPSEVLAVLQPGHDEPRPMRIGGLWKTIGPQGAES